MFKNSADQITLENAIFYYKKGINVIVNDGKDLSFSTEKPLAGKQKGQDESIYSHYTTKEEEK